MTSSAKWNEKQLVENRMIKQLQEMGYEHLHGSSLDSERESRGEIILKDRVRKAILRLNSWISDINLTKVIRSITHIESTSLMEANQKFHEMIVNMISIQQDLGKGKKSQTVKLIDFERPNNNEFLVVEQFTISNALGNIRPDLIIFVNGLPLVIVECKSPMLSPDEQIGEGVRQLTRYQTSHEQLFHYNQFMIVTSNDRAKAGTIGAKVQHYGEWKDPYPRTVVELGDSPTPQDILTAGMLTKESLLDLIRNFIVYEPVEGRTIKKLARYQQFRAVNKAINRILHAEDKTQRGGIVWHTQGSGKSLTMVYLAVKLRRIKELKNPTIVVVTDRKDLDDQITNTFRRCGFPNPQQAESVAQLRQLLQQGAGSTIMTLVQKFQEDAETMEFKNLSTAENIFVMIDESHRSQYGGLATTMKSAMPNACYLAFTGTPIDKEDKSTKRTFGPYIDKYTIEQAVKDGATVPIFYEARMVDLHVQGDSLDELFERQFREYSEEDRERIKKKYATEEAIISSRKRIKRIVLDMIEHYETHIQPNGFKAQVVAISREAAVIYKEMLDELSNYESKVIMSAGHNDKEHLQKHHISKEEEKEIINRFKKPMSEDKLCFIIVCDKLLTGFDAPIEQVMYLDKPIKEHNLLQAIARTNRTYDKKTYGLIVDYYGVSRFLEQALNIFNEEDVQGALQSIDTEIPRLQSRHRAVMRFFDYISTENLEACLQVLEPEDIRNEFDTAFKRFSESMDMIMPSPKAHDYIRDLKFLGRVRQLAKSRYREEQMDISDCGEKVKQLIEEHLAAVGIDVVHEPIDILSNKFEKRIEEEKTPEGKAAEMEHAIRHEIRVKLEENPVYYTSLKERLEELLQRRRERQIDIEEILTELRNMVNDMRSTVEKSQEQGFTREQYPFYQMLEKEMPPYEDSEDLKALTHLITDIIQQETVVEWINKEDVKREMRKKIKKQLRVSPCPKDKLESLTQQLIDLAAVHYRK
ncbi:type I restriction endonuclease subunit R [Bacillus altitudinis]|uniref:type I restriction endonuclease subunit R n=1 Tax=Bacillus altitudinis TaxID=293387 RepID=UPI0011A1163C|nr:type I restriction endonuclease subunit R [Bacillus altitudinis]MBU8967508.1 type I restriction endonuclease subunit R [Bacillus altitudinis]MCY7673009.1 type I restriction endonuclease subunit R [Bacillus altitudinis]MDR7667637.1 type I restriction endonuclease subunit R [Bacillus altitudinis]VWA41555.1 Type I restriction-modification system, restriction subunit R (EC 3.1.21.3) [Bacillus altitudinis]